MTIAITDTAVRRAAIEAKKTGKRVELIDHQERGLRLRVSPSGNATWLLAMRDPANRMRRFTLGNFRDFGLADARERARRLRLSVRDGADPTAERRERKEKAKLAATGVGTLASVLDLYEEQGHGAELRSWPEQRRRIEVVFGGFLRRAADGLSSAELQVTADAHPARYSAAAAVRYLRPVLKWAARRGYLPAEAALLQQSATVQRRERVLSEEELRTIIPVLDASPRPYARALQFMLLTMARREEVCAARWRDIDLAAGTWRIPHTKSGREHVLPLSRQAVALLHRLGPRAADALVFATESGGHLSNWDRETKAIMECSGTVGWTRHDLRRTGATLLGELGFEPHVIEAALNHAAIHSPLAATYNRSRYQPEVAKALQALADRLDGIVAGAADVVQLQRA